MRASPPSLVFALAWTLSACASPAGSIQQSSATNGTAFAASSGTALVANQQSASATIIDVATRTGTTIPVGTGPHEAAISPDGRWGVVTIYGTQQPGNQLAVVDLDAKTVVRTIDLGNFRRPHGAAFIAGSSSMVALTSEASQRVVLADIAAGTIVADVPTNSAGSHMLGITSDGKRIFTANISTGSISEIDVDRRAFVRQLPVSTMTEGIGVRPDGSEVWVGSNDKGTVSIVDTKSWSVVKTLTGFAFPYRIGFSPDGRWAVVCDPQGNKIHIADVPSRTIVGTVGDLGSPRGVRIAPDNRTAYVTVNAESVVAAVDLVNRTVLFKVPVGTSPDGVGYGRK